MEKGKKKKRRKKVAATKSGGWQLAVDREGRREGGCGEDQKPRQMIPYWKMISLAIHFMN